MNYIELINNFWILDEYWQFTCCETRLYFYLVKTANCLGWVNDWTHSDVKTSANVGVSINSLKTARNRLIQAGLINVYAGGKFRGNKVRYQILTPYLTPYLEPKPIPYLIPNLEPNGVSNPHELRVSEGAKLNQTKLNQKEEKKEIKKKKIPVADEKIKSWKNDFQIYLSELKCVYNSLLSDLFYLSTQERLHPGIDIKLSMEKAVTNFWATEAGWNYKKSKKSKILDWKSTLTHAIDLNKVYKQREDKIPNIM